MNDLVDKKCSPCKQGTPPLKGEKLEAFAKKLKGEWKIVSEHHLEREYLFKDFKEAWDFTNQIGTLSEEENHHPDIHLGWGKVRIMLWTHKIDGLSENDFILAAKISRLDSNDK